MNHSGFYGQLSPTEEPGFHSFLEVGVFYCPLKRDKYGPWGEFLGKTGTVDIPFRYAGYYYDDETGRYYLKGRYYNPELSRFLTKDDLNYSEIKNPQTLNLYAYTKNNPIRGRKMPYPRKGLRIRCDKEVHPEVRSACLKFGKWLRENLDFPIRVIVYLKEDYQLKNQTTKKFVTATFFAPYDKNIEPYIRIATGDYNDLIKERGKVDALYAMLDSIAHEIIHYLQWLEGNKLNDIEAEEKGYELVDKYSETIETILDF